MFADLLPCPFCGGKAIHNVNPAGDNYDYWVTCDVCGSHSDIYEGVNGSVSAYQAWNRRTCTKESACQQTNNIQSVAETPQICQHLQSKCFYTNDICNGNKIDCQLNTAGKLHTL